MTKSREYERGRVIIHFNMIFHSRISVSWVWAVLGRGCLMRSRHCRMSIMITPIRITQTTRPPMIRISCKSTGINAERHGRLKSRLFGSSSETWMSFFSSPPLFLLPFFFFCLSFFLIPSFFFSSLSKTRVHHVENKKIRRECARLLNDAKSARNSRAG